jgi:predicted ribosome quality control (RQC) complex YloA/Tae2 family protein
MSFKRVDRSLSEVKEDENTLTELEKILENSEMDDEEALEKIATELVTVKVPEPDHRTKIKQIKTQDNFESGQGAFRRS